MSHVLKALQLQIKMQSNSNFNFCTFRWNLKLQPHFQVCTLLKILNLKVFVLKTGKTCNKIFLNLLLRNEKWMLQNIVPLFLICFSLISRYSTQTQTIYWNWLRQTLILTRLSSLGVGVSRTVMSSDRPKPTFEPKPKVPKFWFVCAETETETES